MVQRLLQEQRGGQNPEWGVQKTHMGVTVRCPHTFGQIVFFWNAEAGTGSYSINVCRTHNAVIFTAISVNLQSYFKVEEN